MARLIVIGTSHPFDELTRKYRRDMKKMMKRVKRSDSEMRMQIKSLENIDKKPTRSLVDINRSLMKIDRSYLTSREEPKVNESEVDLVARKLTRQMSIEAGESFFKIANENGRKQGKA
eukprot:UN20196